MGLMINGVHLSNIWLLYHATVRAAAAAAAAIIIMVNLYLDAT